MVSPGKAIIVGLMGLIPTTALLGAYGAAKDKNMGNLSSAAIGALAGGVGTLAVGVASWYLLGLGENNSQTNGLGLISARRVGLVEATKKQAIGMMLDNCPGCKVY